ncbi:MAG TPA: HdeD family acid-resistance protein [Burkholderiales bacterium]|nr:HdeD family acid-resistance protein [Burkholderiales bacterium]
MDLPVNAAKAFQCDSKILLNARWRRLMTQGCMMLATGVLAAALPVTTTLTIDVIIGFLLLAGGAWRLVAQLRMSQSHGFGWYLALSCVSIVLGAAVLLVPLTGMRTLTALLFGFFVIEGVGKILFAMDLRTHGHEWRWPLLTGALDLSLAVLILAGWPSSAAWTLGLLVGVNLMFFGASLIVIALAARRGRHRDLEKITREFYVPKKESSPAR